MPIRNNKYSKTDFNVFPDKNNRFRVRLKDINAIQALTLMFYDGAVPNLTWQTVLFYQIGYVLIPMAHTGCKVGWGDPIPTDFPDANVIRTFLATSAYNNVFGGYFYLPKNQIEIVQCNIKDLTLNSGAWMAAIDDHDDFKEYRERNGFQILYEPTLQQLYRPSPLQFPYSLAGVRNFNIGDPFAPSLLKRFKPALNMDNKDYDWLASHTQILPQDQEIELNKTDEENTTDFADIPGYASVVINNRFINIPAKTKPHLELTSRFQDYRGNSDYIIIYEERIAIPQSSWGKHTREYYLMAAFNKTQYAILAPPQPVSEQELDWIDKLIPEVDTFMGFYINRPKSMPIVRSWDQVDPYKKRQLRGLATDKGNVMSSASTNDVLSSLAAAGFIFNVVSKGSFYLPTPYVDNYFI